MIDTAEVEATAERIRTALAELVPELVPLVVVMPADQLDSYDPARATTLAPALATVDWDAFLAWPCCSGSSPCGVEVAAVTASALGHQAHDPRAHWATDGEGIWFCCPSCLTADPICPSCPA